MWNFIERFCSENDGRLACCEDSYPKPCWAQLTEAPLTGVRCRCGVPSLVKGSRIPNTDSSCRRFLNVPWQRPRREVKLAQCKLSPKLRFIFWKIRSKGSEFGGESATPNLSTSNPRAAWSPPSALQCALCSYTDRATFDVGFSYLT